MSRIVLSSLAAEQLREKFIEIAVKQGRALLGGDTKTFNRLYDKMAEIELELKSRPGDQRSILLPLLDHPNLAVRWKAALATAAVSPPESRTALESVAKSGEMPVAGHAGMNLHYLDSGLFKPS